MYASVLITVLDKCQIQASDNLLLLVNGYRESLSILLQTVWDPYLDITLREIPTIAVFMRLFSKAKFTSLV